MGSSAKYHVALVVLATWACGYFVDKSIPYFPIEISRTGTGQYSSQVFRWGALSLALTLWWENHFQWSFTKEMLASPLIVWWWVMWITWFPDDTHNTIHIFCVVCMSGCIFLNVCLVGDVARRLLIFLCAMVIQGAGIGIKIFGVLFTELDRNLFDWHVYVEALLNVKGLRDEIVKQIKDIMFRGVDHAIQPTLTIPLFRVTGVFQWLAFYLMMSLY